MAWEDQGMKILQNGQIIANRYRLKNRLPDGYRTQLWRAADESTSGAEMVLKFFETEKKLDSQIVLLIANEFLSISIRHQYLLMPVATMFEEDSPLIVMPYMSRGSLASFKNFDSRRPVSEAHLLKLMMRLLSVLMFLHKNSFIHQDISPENILFGETGGVFLSDFGVSRILHNMAGHEKGPNRILHPAYASPERFVSQHVTWQDDIFAVGAVMFEIVTGLPPWDGEGGKALLEGAMPPDRVSLDYSDEFNDIVLACLAMDPDERPRANRLEEMLHECLKLNTGNRLKTSSDSLVVVETESKRNGSRQPPTVTPYADTMIDSANLAESGNREAKLAPAGSIESTSEEQSVGPDGTEARESLMEEGVLHYAAGDDNSGATSGANAKPSSRKISAIADHTMQSEEVASRDRIAVLKQAAESAERKSVIEAMKGIRDESEKRLRNALEVRLREEFDTKLSGVLEQVRQAAEIRVQEAEQRVAGRVESRAREMIKQLQQEETEKRLRIEAEHRELVAALEITKKETERLTADASAKLAAREEADRRAKEEAERAARLHQERMAREAAEQSARAELERRERAEAERRMREEAERIALAEARARDREESERLKNEEIEKLARLETERLAEDFERSVAEEVQRRYEEIRIKLLGEEEDRRKKEECERNEAMRTLLTIRAQELKAFSDSLEDRICSGIVSLIRSELDAIASMLNRWTSESSFIASGTHDESEDHSIRKASLE